MDSSAEADPLLHASRHITLSSASSKGDSSNQYIAAITTANCSISSTHVESVVNCTSASCSVAKIRRSLEDDRDSVLTALDIDAITSGVITGLPSIAVSQDYFQSSAVEIFINDTSNAPYSGSAYDGYVDLSSVPATEISTRFGIVLNTYLQIVSNPVAFLGDLPQNISLYGPDTSPINAISTWFGSNATLDNVLAGLNGPDDSIPALSDKNQAALAQAPFVADTANAQVTQRVLIHVCSRIWAALLLLGAGLLLHFGILGAFLNFWLVVPDMLGYVSSMTYDNTGLRQDQELPLDAIERARILRDLPVRIGDTKKSEEVGHLALTTAQGCESMNGQKRYYTS